jgi:hypothetical protein
MSPREHWSESVAWMSPKEHWRESVAWIVQGSTGWTRGLDESKGALSVD